MEINSQCASDRNIHFYTLLPLVWKRVGTMRQIRTKTYSVPQFGSLCSQFRGIHRLERTLSHGNYFVYRQTDNDDNALT